MTAPAIEPRPTPGINVIGYLRGELGLGEFARKLVAAVERTDIPLATLTYDRIGNRQEHPFEDRGQPGAPYDTNVICVNARQLPELREDVGPELFGGRYSIGVWFWELSRFPPELHRAFDLVDEVWVASEFVRAALARETEKPVLVVPAPLEPPEVRPRPRAELGLPDGFLFLFSFDFFSVLERKNAIGLVDAFGRAFGPEDDAVLVIKTMAGDRKPEDLARLRQAVERRPNVRLVDRYVAAEERDAIVAACDCYVSLHRSEGLGLTMAEAMALAKPVIATGYSGNLTFMTDENSYLVRHGFSTTPARLSVPPGIEWAEPDLDHAAELMRRVYEHPEEARERGERARRDLLEAHTVDHTAAFVRERFASIPRHDRLLREVRGPLERAAMIASREPGASLVSGRGLVGAVRRVLRRLLWPELADQRAVDAAVLEALRALERVTREELGQRRDRGR